MKRIALLIAIGLIIAGTIVGLWPVPCEDNPFIATCITGLVQAIEGLLIFVPGIILLILLPISNSRHRILAIIGIGINFILAIALICGGVWAVINVTSDFTLQALVAAISIIASLGFVCAGLSGIRGKENAPRSNPDNLVTR